MRIEWPSTISLNPCGEIVETTYAKEHTAMSSLQTDELTYVNRLEPGIRSQLTHYIDHAVRAAFPDALYNRRQRYIDTTLIAYCVNSDNGTISSTYAAFGEHVRDMIYSFKAAEEKAAKQ